MSAPAFTSFQAKQEAPSYLRASSQSIPAGYGTQLRKWVESRLCTVTFCPNASPSEMGGLARGGVSHAWWMPRSTSHLAVKESPRVSLICWGYWEVSLKKFCQPLLWPASNTSLQWPKHPSDMGTESHTGYGTRKMHLNYHEMDRIAETR